ncbi:MAG: response regulator [Burkholderiales bacterium]|nr:response regulator [Burkholderiales bacterium]
MLTSKTITSTRPRFRWIDWALVLGLLVIGCGMSWTIFRGSQEAVTAQNRERLNAAGLSVTDALDLNLRQTVGILTSAGHMIASRQGVGRGDFLAFSRRVMTEPRMLSFLEWQPVIPAEKLPAFEAAARRDGYPSFRVVEPKGEGWAPVQGRAEYVPVLYAAPEGSGAIGVDMGFDPGRMESKYQARDSGMPVASGVFRIISSNRLADEAQAFAISVPVYHDVNPKTMQARKASLIGYAAGVIELPVLLHEVALRAQSVELELTITDRGGSGPVPIFSTVSNSSQHSSASTWLPNGEVEDLSITIDVASRPWELVLHPGPGFYAKRQGSRGAWGGAIGLVATGLLTFAAYRLIRARQRVERAQAVTQAARNQLAEERQHLANVIEGTNAGTWEWNVQTGEVQLNHRWVAMLGYTLEELAPIAIHTWESLIHPADYVLANERLQRHFSGETPLYECEFRMRHKDGHWVWVLARGQALTRSAEGAPQWVAGTHTDVSSRVQAERRLADQLRFVQVLVESLPIAIYEKDVHGKYVRFNRAFERLVGIDRRDWLGKDVYELVDDPIKARQMADSDAELMRTLVPDHYEARVRNFQTQEVRDGLFHKAPILDSEGRVTGLVGAVLDVSDKNAANRQIEATMRELKQATEAKSQFLANMSHEIRTPMNAILGMLTLLNQTDLTSQQHDYATKAESATRSLLGIINDILDFSKLEAGKMPLDPQPFRLSQLLQDLSLILSSSVKSRDVQVLYTIDPLVPDHLVGDALRLQQVLINLGGNAVKFTPNGTVVIDIRHLDSRETRVRVGFSVQDTGIGISAQQQQHIFSGFSQAEASTTRKFGGTGLGLAISKRLVEMMGGQIQLQSARGDGSRFSFELELERSPQQESGAAAGGPALRALVVDGHPVALQSTLALLASLGWTTHAVASGEEALAYLECQPPGLQCPCDVVFLEARLPGADGWRCAQRLHAWAQQRWDGSPAIVMLTNAPRSELAQRTHEEQSLIQAYLMKPVTATMLAQAAQAGATGAGSVRRRVQAPSSRRRLEGMRILVVEDNQINQQVAEELLAREGALISLAMNGELGVQAVKAAQPQFDAVLMDLQMPVMDGYQATHAIRYSLGLSTLPIVAMTANALAEDRQACLDAGMNEHVGKPFDLDHLVSTLLRVTAFHPAALPSTPTPAAGAQTLTTWPELQHIAAQAALERMGCLHRLYASGLREWERGLPANLEKLQVVLTTDPVAATAVAHTLKGTAATLGLQAVAQAAAAIEQHCKAQDPVQALQALLDDLVQRTTLAAQDIPALLTWLDSQDATLGDSISPPETAPADMASLLRPLEYLLERSDMAALLQVEQLAPHVDARDQPYFQRLRSAVHSLEFGHAVTVCRQWRQRRGEVQTG